MMKSFNFLISLIIFLCLNSKAYPQENPKDTVGIKDLKMAYSTFCLAGELIDKMRLGYKAEGSKLFLGQRATTVYDKSIRTSLKLYDVLKEDQYKEKAFLFSEKNKSSVLLASLSESKAKQFSDIPDSLLMQEKELKIDLAFYDKSIAEELDMGREADTLKIALWQDKLFHLKQSYDALIKALETNYPKYYKLKYEIKTARVQDIQNKILNPYTALIEYFTGDTTIHIFVITKNDYEIVTIPKDSAFYDQVMRMRDGIYKKRFPLYTYYAFPLYQKLIEPVLKLPIFAENVQESYKITNLIIIPDGVLGYLPFEALLTRKPEEGVEQYASLAYLLNDFSVSYAYSATLLYENMVDELRRDSKSVGNSMNKNMAQGDFLAFAPVFKEKMGIRNLHGSALPPLPATEKEVDAIHKMFSDKKLKSKIFKFENANEKSIKNTDLTVFRFIHFATHGLIDEEKPQLSGIVMAEDSLSAEDGTLYSGEIFNLKLNADLVVLSACETGLGKVVRGEGIMGLSRGFLYAGAKNLIVSLWRVGDNSTADLMLELYKNVLENETKMASLRNAKLKMIAGKTYASPYFWAPFILIGI